MGDVGKAFSVVAVIGYVVIIIHVSVVVETEIVIDVVVNAFVTDVLN